MKIAIVGAGIVGMSTAYELAQDGHEVTVFEQRNAAAEEASFANAGLLLPHLLTPWATPGLGAPLKLLGRRATLRLAQGVKGSDLAWLWRWRRAARHGAQAAQLSALEGLARYSQQRLQHIAAQHALDFESTQGRLILLRTPQEQARWQATLPLLRDAGVALREVDADAARQIEPGLCPETPLAGALHLPDAMAGNCRLFAQLLRQGTQTAGVQFAWGAQVVRLTSQPTGVQVQGESNTRPFDAVVLCAGMASAALLRPLGLRLPLAAVHGYSVSAPLREAVHAPVASVLDSQQQISITRLGQRVRIAGGAELGGPGAAHHAPTLQQLYLSMNEWFPGGALLSSGLQVWRGARPTLPDGAPVVGASGLPGLWLNTGHGAGGWALASGCARAVADLIGQRSPDVSLEGLGIQRF